MTIKSIVRWIGIITLLVLLQVIAIKLSETVFVEYNHSVLLSTGWVSCLIYHLLIKK